MWGLKQLVTLVVLDWLELSLSGWTKGIFAGLCLHALSFHPKEQAVVFIAPSHISCLQELREVKEKLRRMKQGKTCTTSEFGRWSMVTTLKVMEQSFIIPLSCASWGSDRHKNEYQAFKQDLEAKLYTLLFSCRILLERKYSDLGDLGEKKLYADIFRMSGRQWSPGSSRRSGYRKAICSRNLTTLTCSFELFQDMNDMKICEDIKQISETWYGRFVWHDVQTAKLTRHYRREKTAFKKHQKHLLNFITLGGN